VTFTSRLALPLVAVGGYVIVARATPPTGAGGSNIGSPFVRLAVLVAGALLAASGLRQGSDRRRAYAIVSAIGTMYFVADLFFISPHDAHPNGLHLWEVPVAAIFSGLPAAAAAWVGLRRVSRA
jgi:hypothetical protein